MNTPSSKSWFRWERLLAQARADVGPPIDVPLLLRAVRHASLDSRPGWAAEFAAVFSSGRIIPACFACAAGITAIALWQVWQWWDALPWAQWLVTSGGIA